ncbi:MAG: YbbC/YhhH family protein [Armatimonadota bacterium]
MTRANIGLLSFLCLTTVCVVGRTPSLQAAPPKHNYVPPAGYVPDAKTAIHISVAIWSPIYGEEQIQKEKPFHASLTKDIWTVHGSLPKHSVGGVAVAEISKQDGHILRVSHGK